MVNRNNDELARALEGLAAGEHVEPPEGEAERDDHAALHPEPAPAPPASAPPAPSPPRAPVPRQASTPAPRPPSSKPAPAGPARPASSAASASARPSRPPPPLPPSAAARAPRPSSGSAPASRPVRAAAPISGSAPPAPRPSSPKPARPSAPVPTRAAAPVAPAPIVEEAPSQEFVTEDHAADSYGGAPAQEESIEAQHEHQAEAIEHVVEDDDSVIVPPPPIDALGHQHIQYARKVHIPTFKSMSLRQTLIPVLLTSGVMISLFGICRFFVREEAPLAALQPWMCLTAICVGLVLACLGVLNMLLIRQQLITQQEAREGKK